MGSIQLLYSQDFQQVGQRTKTMAIKTPDPILVLFKMIDCPNCKVVEPIFVQLSKERDVPPIRYGIIDLTQQKDLIALSKPTTTPLQAVPTLILYANGRPLAKFNGTKNLPSLKNFIKTALSSAQTAPPQQEMHQPQQFMPSTMGGGGGGNMYGGFPQMNQPQQAGQRGQPQPRVPPRNMPEFGGTPMAAQKPGNTSYKFGMVEEDDDHRLSLPNDVIPYNAPWEDSSYKRMNE